MTSLLARLHPPAHPDAKDPQRPLRFLHRFSDSVLHTVLMVGLILLVGLALYKAVTLTINIWRLDTVVVDGKSTPARPVPLPAPQQK